MTKYEIKEGDQIAKYMCANFIREIEMMDNPPAYANECEVIQSNYHPLGKISFAALFNNWKWSIMGTHSYTVALWKVKRATTTIEQRLAARESMQAAA